LGQSTPQSKRKREPEEVVVVERLAVGSTQRFCAMPVNPEVTAGDVALAEEVGGRLPDLLTVNCKHFY
jgi:hypothetical protein